MTVSSTTTKVSYSGNGSTTAFAYTFKIFDEDDLTVILRTDATGTEAVQTKTSDYTVSGVGNANGGNVTFGTAPASGKTVVIRRSAALTQTTDYTPNDPFPAEEHENALDKLTFLTQQIQEEVDRSIKLSRTNTMTSTEFTVGATDRANKILAFDSSGEISVTQELGTFVGDWAASTSYNARDIVKDTSTNNIFICTTSHTSSGSQPLTTNTDSAKWSLLVDAASATTAATTATTKASEAAASATAAASSATSATSSASSATSSASTASTAATAAQTAQTAAETAETNAETAETNAETAETNAASSATAAASSATSAASSATTATTKASEASTSATNAAASATTATTKASEAATSATNASSSASTATTKASEASTSATNAASSATAAASSATASASSATSAANSAAAAAASYDQFDDRYLGSKTSDPSVDNDGNALVTGALYFNSSANEMRVYDGANWIAASSAGTASLILYEYTATSGQTTFSGSDDNSATLSYSVGNIQVVMNGVILDPSDFTATSGTSVVLASGAATGDLLNIYAFKSFTVSDTVSASAGGTFAGNVNVTGNLDVDGTTTLDGLTVDGDVTLNDGSPNLRLKDTDTNRFVDLLYGTRVSTIRNTMASGEDMDTVEPSMVFSFKDDGETRTAMTIDHDAATTIHSSGGATPTYSHTNNGEGLTFRYNDDSGARAADIVAVGNTPAGATMAMRFFTSPNSTDNAAEVMRIQNGAVTVTGAFEATSSIKSQGVYNNTTGSGANLVVDSAGGFARSTSSQRYKNTISDATHGLTELLALRPVTYKHNGNGDTVFGGLIAEEVHAAGLTEFVDYSQDDNGDDQPEALHYANMVSLCIKAIQEQQATITALTARITALENI